MKPKIYIRVNVEQNKGMGHWVRCTALASMLESHFDCIFLLQTANLSLIENTRNLGFDCHLIPSAISLLEEPKYLAQNFLNRKEILVLDSYDFQTDYQIAIKAYVGKLVCIDDIHHTYFVADAIINHAGGISPKNYQCDPSTQLFLGLDYLLLRKPFLQKERKEELEENDLGKVLICMGGEDPKNDTLKILARCEQLDKIRTCEVVIGANYRYMAALKLFCAQTNLTIRLSHQLNAAEMCQKMKECHTVICPPSTVALEFLSLGGNVFLHQIADNQKHIAHFLYSNGLAFKWDRIQETTAAELKNARAKQQFILDQKSPERILSIFRTLQQSIDLTFRKANIDDLLQYFTWANDEDTRSLSFNAEPIPLEQHTAWFNKRLEDPESLLLLMEQNGKMIGQIRFHVSQNTATISYSIDKESRGKGYGKLLIRGGIDYLQRAYPSITKIEGFVKLNNIPSIKTFQRLGFSEEHLIKPYAQMKYIHQLKKAN